MFLAFSLEQLCSDLSRKVKKSAFIKSTHFKSFDSEVPSFYFGSMPMPPIAHKHFLQKRQ